VFRKALTRLNDGWPPHVRRGLRLLCFLQWVMTLPVDGHDGCGQRIYPVSGNSVPEVQ